MKYNYVCSNCNEEIDVELPLGSDLPKEIDCECGGVKRHALMKKLKQDSQNIIIPESFKAMSKINDTSKLYGKFNVHEKTLY